MQVIINMESTTTRAEVSHAGIEATLSSPTKMSKRERNKQILQKIASISSKEHPSSKYLITKKLGFGAFGQVFHGQDLKRPSFSVAVKIITQPTEPAQTKRTLNEIRCLRQCDHPNITKFSNCFVVPDKKLIYLAMEFVDGMDLFEFERHVRLCRRQIAYVCKEVLQGLQHLHNLHIMHRDIKDDNILLSKAGEVKLTDLGLSIRERPHLESGIGSEFYIAPEALNTNSYTCKIDIWSLGILVFKMARRKYPYSTERLAGAKTLDLIERKVRPRLPSSMPPSMKSILDLCFQIEPEKRPTAAELLKHEFLQSTASSKDLAVEVNRAVCLKENMHPKSAKFSPFTARWIITDVAVVAVLIFIALVGCYLITNMNY